jgi:hypothetical protein
VDDPGRCSEFFALESNAPALAIPLLRRFFSPPEPVSSVDFRPGGEANEFGFSPECSTSSSPGFKDVLSGIAPSPVFGFDGECGRLVSLSFDGDGGLCAEPNILFNILPPCEEKLLLLFLARMIVEFYRVPFETGT